MGQNEMLRELRNSHRKLEEARQSNDATKIGHALGNFLACAEVVARRALVQEE